MKGNAIVWAGYALTGLSVLFLLMDAGMKLAEARPAMEATAQLGFDPGFVRTLGAILLVCTLLYTFPATSVLGAVLLTAYLGGAVAIHVQQKSPLFTHILFGVYLGLFVWGGLFLRMSTLRALFPIARG